MNSTVDNSVNSPAGFVAGKFLSFRLSSEEYGIAILEVREILPLPDITPLPQTPDFIRGVINLRGKIIPVIDLRRRFGLPPADFTNDTCIVVVDSGRAEDGATPIGCIVDAVSEVLAVGPKQVERAPRSAEPEFDYIHGLAVVEDRVIILLDVSRVIGDLAPNLPAEIA